MSQPLRLFISYANEDEHYKNTLIKILKPLERKKMIASWHDGAIEVGKQWETQLKNALEGADVLIFLVSTDFTDSDYINDVELKKAIERYEAGEVAIVPIYIRPLPFHDDFLDKFQALPKNRKAISTWSNMDEAWADVGTQLHRLFERLLQPAATDRPTDNAPKISSSNDNNETSIEQQVRNFIGRGKTKDALDKLLEYSETRDSDKHSEVLLLSGRWSNIERQERQGLMTYSEVQMERNRINASLLAVLEDMES